MSFDYNTYDWARGLSNEHEANERAIWAALAILGRPQTYLDLGCGDGWMVHTAAMAGIEALGIEGSQACIDAGSEWADIRLHDLTTPLELGRQFELVSCIEVAEHLPIEAAKILVSTIRRHTYKWILWTAAPPGQGGDGHINCQPPEYWEALFEQTGAHVAVEETALMKTVWTKAAGGLFWLAKNVVVFYV
jgi:SAM-dependent methyltransferase